jgi:hypothetical protein
MHAAGVADCLMLRESATAKTWAARKERKVGKLRARGALACRIGRTVYHLWRKQECFDAAKFLAS